MKLQRLVSFLIALISGVVFVWAENNYKVSSPSPLNVRNVPSKTGDILGTFQSGQNIEVLSVDNGWAKVKLDGNTGYVMVEYIEPLIVAPKSNGQSAVAVKADGNIAPNNNSMSPEDVDPFEAERKNSVYELVYSAASFDDVKLTGSYGISFTILPWKMAPQLYGGIHCSPLNFNYGLVDSDYTSSVVKLGPALGYYFTPKMFLAVPLDLICDIYTNGNDETETAWGMSLAPTVYIGSGGGVFFGPQFTIGFEGDSDISCGFRAGIYF